MIKKFENYNNDVEEYSFYIFNGKIIYITSINNFGNQIEVKYINEDGFINNYIADTKSEVNEDFINTSKKFKLTKKVKSNNKLPNIKSKSKRVKDIDRYNVEQYTGKRHTATTDWNLPIWYALARIKDYKNDPAHRGLEYRLKKN